MRELQKSSEVILEYLKEYPKMKHLTLAKLIYKENPGLYKTVDSARSSIRFYKGQQGDERRGLASTTEFFTEPKFINQFHIPSEAQPIEPYILPLNANRILILSDIHFPYHDNNAINASLDYGQHKEMNTILLNGDILDNYQQSKFARDPRKRDLKYEIDVFCNFIEYIRKQYPDVLVYYKQGNHDERYDRYLRDKAPELLGIKEVEFEYITHLEKYSVNYIKGKRIIRAGKLSIIHGHEIRGAGGVNPARWLYLKGKVNAICGHFHRTSEHSEPDLKGSPKGCWSMGCLCELNPEYDPNPASNKWNHGCAFVEWDNENFTVHNKRIIKGQIV